MARAAARVFAAASDKYPFTLLGTLLAGCGVVAVREFGQKRQDVVLYVAGLGALAVALVAGLLVVVGAVVVYRGVTPRRLPTERVEAGRIVDTGFSLPSLRFTPLLSVGWRWLAPTAVRVEQRDRGGRIAEEVVFGERGEHDRTVRRIFVEDVLGIARVAFRSTDITPRVVRPALGRPLTAPLLEAYAAGDGLSHPAGPPDGDLIDMRRYAMGDPMKRILWKVYARSRTLMVRLPERAISPTERTLAYLCAGPGDEAAASIARMAVDSGALGPAWRFSADQPAPQPAPPPAPPIAASASAASPPVAVAAPDATDAPAALSLIIRSRAARDSGGEGFGRFLDRNEAWGGRCVLFAPGRPGPWVDPVLAEIRRRPGRVEVLLGVDGVIGAERAERWKRLFLLDERGAAPGRADNGSDARVAAGDLDDLGRALVAAGATVTVVDRPTGRVHARSARRRRAA